MVDFARHYQVVNPFRAWPYAVEAQYSSDRGARAKALGMAVYVDPNSVRLQQFSPEELDKARAWAKTARPFNPVEAPPKSSRPSTAVVMNRAAESAAP